MRKILFSVLALVGLASIALHPAAAGINLDNLAGANLAASNTQAADRAGLSLDGVILPE